MERPKICLTLTGTTIRENLDTLAKYKDKIDIKLGFEVEYYPQLFEQEIKLLAEFEYDYITYYYNCQDFF